MLTFIKKILIVLIVFIYLGLLGSVNPTGLIADEVIGEIINVNYREKVAFIDLGNESLGQGDVLVVEDDGQKYYLEVQEVNDAVTKLVPSTNAQYPSNPEDFKEILVGSNAKRVWVKQIIQQPPVVETQTTSSANSSITAIPVIDPQTMTKPNIANETIQSLDIRLDKMVESNVKLFNALNELLAEKKNWESQTTAIKNDLQAALQKVHELSQGSADIKKQIADAKIEAAGAVADREKYKKQAEDLQIKLDQLKAQFDRLTNIVDEQIKNVSQ